MSTYARLHAERPASPAASNSFRPAFAGRLVQAIAGLFERSRRRHEARLAERQLREFDEHLLRDIGLHRLDIRHATRFGRMDERGDERDTPAGKR